MLVLSIAMLVLSNFLHIKFNKKIKNLGTK
jgi:hypothetical protein